MERSEFVTIGDARFWTARSGSGVPLVWLHGGPGLWDMAAPLAAMVDDLAASYRYEQRGCGRSTGEGPHTVARTVADLDALRAYWGLERIALAGHSWGATLALHYALAHPSCVTGVIYLSGTGIDPAWRAAYGANRERLFGGVGMARLEALEQAWKANGSLADERAFCRHAWSIDFADPQQGALLAERMFVGDLRVNPAVNAELNTDNRRATYGAPLDDAVAKLPMPFLAIHGSADPRPARYAHALAALIPNGRFIGIDGAGHLPWFEKPDAVRGALRDFIRALA